ncbi:protein LEG1 homolog isoform X2 [Hyperolius riggenbachi]|uniref:protein LEG1 homolog isoform X2 n=1 Tax=Hyperolius riggenbachi TaxID=752182 RepID=UPI0035A28ADC
MGKPRKDLEASSSQGQSTAFIKTTVMYSYYGATVKITLLCCKMNGLFLFSLILVYGSAAPDITDNGSYPPMWDRVPGSLSDFRIQDGKVVIDPWNYLERMGMYKILLNITAPFLDMKKPDNKKNILWGLPLQHGWQFHTGRLTDDSQATTCGPNSNNSTCISGRSWWACMNYYLAVVPFLGALDTELLQNSTNHIQILRPKELENGFCTSIAECRSLYPQAMDGWKTFFEVIKASKSASDKSVSTPSNEGDRFLSYMWKAHVESINAGLPHCSTRLRYLSAPEGNFGTDWATAVEFIAATHFPTDFQSTNEFQIFLPHRKLVDGDKAPYIADFTEQENRVLSTLNLINKTNSYSGGLLLRFWKRAMCSDKARAAGQDLLRNVVNNSHMTAQNILTIIMELVNNPTCG